MGSFRPKIVFAQAQADEVAGKPLSASRKYAKVASYLMRHVKYREAKNLLRRAVELNPSAPRVYLELGLCEALLKNESGAIHLIEQFVGRAIKNGKASHYVDLVESKLESFTVLRATYYRSWLEKEPNIGLGLLGYARALRDLQKWDEARQVLVKSLQNPSDRDEAIALLREVLQESHTLDALYYVQRFEQGHISSKELIFLLGSDQPRSREIESVKEETLDNLIEALEQKLGLNDTGEDSSVGPIITEFCSGCDLIMQGDGRARMDMAVAFFVMELYAQAELHLNMVSFEDTWYIPSQVLLGDLRFRQGKWLEALEVYQACLRMSGISRELKKECEYRLAEIFFKLGDLRAAWKTVEKLWKRASDYRDLKGLRATIKEQIGIESLGSRQRRK